MHSVRPEHRNRVRPPSELCTDIKEPVRSRNGRPRIACACFKVYSTVSARRFMTDLREAQAKGFILKTPHFNTIFNYLEDKHLTPILRELITRSSLPLNSIETDFAVDSSGFSASRFVRWFDHSVRLRGDGVAGEKVGHE
jgi:hypothetical protein